MSRRERGIPDRTADPAAHADYLRERIYATFTGLAIVLVVANSGHPEARHAFLALLLGVAGIVAAGLVADILSHLLSHQTLPSRKEAGLLLRVAGGGLSTVVVPGGLLLAALLGAMELHGALRAASIVYVVTLAVIGWLAVRRSRLPGRVRLAVLIALVALGFAVIGLQILAKSV